MKTTFRYTNQGQCIVITNNKKISNVKTAFIDMETAAAEIGILQNEILSLRADVEVLKDELEDCEGYDNDFNNFDGLGRIITEEDDDRDWDN